MAVVIGNTVATDEVAPATPELEEVTLIEGVLLSGQPFTFSIRAGNGDTFEDTPEYLRYVSGVTGEAIKIRQTAIAQVSTITRQLPKVKVKAGAEAYSDFLAEQRKAQ